MNNIPFDEDAKLDKTQLEKEHIARGDLLVEGHTA